MADNKYPDAKWYPEQININIEDGENPVIIIDAAGYILSINKEARNKWRLDSGDIAGKPLLDVFYGNSVYDNDYCCLSPILESLGRRVEFKEKIFIIKTLTSREPSLMKVTTSLIKDDQRIAGVRAVYEEINWQKFLEAPNHRSDEQGIRSDNILNCPDILNGLIDIIGVRDSYTRVHSERVSRYAELISQEMGLPAGQVKQAGLAGAVHDIGKIGIDENILLKPSPLTVDEFNEIKKHPEIGARILSHIGIGADTIPIVMHHHERYDGKGYPGGLKGGRIPLLSRVLAVADTFDAMTSARIYRSPYTTARAVEEIKKNAGSQFDPEVVDAFLKII